MHVLPPSPSASSNSTVSPPPPFPSLLLYGVRSCILSITAARNRISYFLAFSLSFPKAPYKSVAISPLFATLTLAPPRKFTRSVLTALASLPLRSFHINSHTENVALSPFSTAQSSNQHPFVLIWFYPSIPANLSHRFRPNSARLPDFVPITEHPAVPDGVELIFGSTNRTNCT